MSRALLAIAIITGVSGITSRVAAQSSPTPARFLASAFRDWQTLPDGVQHLNLVGDSMTPTGLRAFRLRYPAGVEKDSSKAGVHYHMGTQHVMVIKGTLVVGFGEEKDFATIKEYTGPEGFVVIPSGRPHYHWTRGETEIQVQATGPSGTRPWPRVERPLAAGPRPVPPPDSTHIWKNGLPEWTLGGGGAGRMNLAGNRASTTELVAYRSFRPARANADTSRMIYHYHFGTEHITIIRGTVFFGIGEKADRGKAIAYGPGSFIENPAGAKHFEWFGADGDALYQVEAIGSLGAINLDPATGQPR